MADGGCAGVGFLNHLGKRLSTKRDYFPHFQASPELPPEPIGTVKIYLPVYQQ
jgi:hypothetical protein